MNPSLQSRFSVYNARGNVYAVAHPAALGLLPPASQAALDADALSRGWLNMVRTDLANRKLDGIVIGPFETAPPFNALILNTDGSLAERSGNGLTIFARALVDSGMVDDATAFDVRVHHASGPPDPLVTHIRLVPPDSALVELGTPEFGPSAVAAAQAVAAKRDHRAWTLESLVALNPSWTTSVFVRVGNPHCVTFVGHSDDLPSRAELQASEISLRQIAYAPTKQRLSPFGRGANLQWANVSGDQRIDARIFERGEGWTQSSGSSASAVAAAAFFLGRVDKGEVIVRMPGGEANIILGTDGAGRLETVCYSGCASRIES